MVDVPGTVGYLAVTLGMPAIVGDSNDIGGQPDAVPANANVVIRPIGIPDKRPYVVAGEPPDLYPVNTIFCKVVNGVLYGPANGEVAADAETPALPVHLIDPLSASIDYAGWVWQADFTPIAPDRWQRTFSITFDRATEEDGVTVNLARAALMETNLSAAQVPPLWVVDGDGVSVPAEPAGMLVGQALIDTSTGKIYWKDA